MAEDSLSDTFNPFGLTDSRTLGERRRQARLAEQEALRQQMSGMDLAGYQAGKGIADALAHVLTRTGVVKDMEQERALAVDKAAKDAQAAYDAIPEDKRAKGPFGVAIERRRALIGELEGAGLQREADAVRTQLVELFDQEAKFKKLNAETEGIQLDNERDRAELDATKKGLREKDELTRLQNAHSLLDLNDPIQAGRADQIMARIEKLTTITGTTEFDPSAADKVTLRKVEQSLFENQMTLDGFMQASEAFDPAFQTLAGKVENFALRAADIAGLDLDDATKQQLAAFTTHKQRTSMNLNAYIKAITGAQMSNPEAIRLKKDVPTLDDSPTEYKRKLDNITEKLEAVRQRSLKAMSFAGDRQEFMKVMTTPLEEFIPQAKEVVDEDGTIADAEAALLELEGILGQGQ